MVRRRSPPKGAPRRDELASPPDIYLLDRFSSADVETWNARSRDLDELNYELYFATEPDRLRYRADLIDALCVRPAPPLEIEHWVRVSDYRWAETPLSTAGSLRSWGGRFNVGMDVEQANIAPFPALYLGSTYETAYREKFQLTQDSPSGSGLSPEELALGTSITSVRVNGHIERALDVTDPLALAPVCRILAKIRMPPKAEKLLRRLRMPKGAIRMIKTPAALQRAIMEHNWTIGPSQFGVPSPSQTLAELAIAAGYEAIRYRSVRHHAGHCVALFPANLGSNNTFVELADPSPPSVTHRRLDLDTADALSGWDTVPASLMRGRS